MDINFFHQLNIITTFKHRFIKREFRRAYFFFKLLILLKHDFFKIFLHKLNLFTFLKK